MEVKLSINYIKSGKIKKFLKDNKLSKAEFCRRCGIGQVTLQRILAGKNFNLRALFKIAKFLNIHVCELCSSRKIKISKRAKKKK